MRKVLLLNLLSFLLCLPTVYADASRPSAERIGPVNLRGYGQVTARISYSTASDGSAVSVTRVKCENEKNARLLQAKYLSDLLSLPEVQQTTLEVAGRRGGNAGPQDLGLHSGHRRP